MEKKVKQVLIAVLAVVAMVGIFSWPLDESATWAFDFIASKAVGFGAAWGAYKLSGSEVGEEGGEL